MAFTYTEIIGKRYLKDIPESLELSKTKWIEAKLIRLLIGTTNITEVSTGKIIRQRKNYCNALGSINRVITAKTINSSFSPLTIKDVDIYLNKFKNLNYNLHSDLLFEFSLYFLNREKRNHLSSFLHLYRIFEFISYAFPLIHSSSSKNYIGTFKSLQSYFTKDGSELEFVNTFVKKLFEGDPIFASNIDISVTATDSLIQTKVYKSYKTILSEFITYDDSIEKIIIPYKNVISATIFLRNRYFHFALGGQKNIRSLEIEYPDIFFEQINEPFLNWLVIIYFEVLKTSISNWKS